MKEELRLIKGAIADAEAAANEPNTEIPASDYLELVASLKIEAEMIQQKISMWEERRQKAQF